MSRSTTAGLLPFAAAVVARIAFLEARFEKAALVPLHLFRLGIPDARRHGRIRLRAQTTSRLLGGALEAGLS